MHIVDKKQMHRTYSDLEITFLTSVTHSVTRSKHQLYLFHESIIYTRAMQGLCHSQPPFKLRSKLSTHSLASTVLCFVAFSTPMIDVLHLHNRAVFILRHPLASADCTYGHQRHSCCPGPLASQVISREHVSLLFSFSSTTDCNGDFLIL